MIRTTLAFLAILLLILTLPSQVFANETEGQKAVLITGASSGLGRDATERLAAAGYFVYAGARKAADIDELNTIENVMAVRLDVTKQDEIDAAVEIIRKEGRGLWGVVNNAGVNVWVPLIEADISDVEFVFDVNVYGVFRVTKAFAPLVIESQGRIVNISSASGFSSSFLYGIYSASKHAVEAFTDSLAEEMRNLGVGVGVVAIEPGGFESQIALTFCKRTLADEDAEPYRYFEERRQLTLSRCREALKRGAVVDLPPPDEVSAAIEHALFDKNPKPRYLVEPSQEDAGETISKVMTEMLELNSLHEYSYTRDELLELMDAYWPFFIGEKSVYDLNDRAEIIAFVEAWMAKKEPIAK